MLNYYTKIITHYNCAENNRGQNFDEINQGILTISFYLQINQIITIIIITLFKMFEGDFFII